MQTQKIAVVFPGQGSQSLGMLNELAKRYPAILKTFEEASSIFGEDLWALSQTGPLEKINSTAWTQPLLLAADIAVWRLFCELIPNVISSIHYLAGHSLGEYAALVASGALSFESAMQLVIVRGLAMQDAVPNAVGAMGAIVGLTDEMISDLCQDIIMRAKLQTQSQSVLSPANFNSPGQVVIAGHKNLVQHALDEAKSKGAKMAVILPVSVPSHCELMQAARDAMEKPIKNTVFKKTHISVIRNVDAKGYSSPAEIGTCLLAQLTQPVQWVKTVEYLLSAQVNAILECGPGRVLTGLNKRIIQNYSTKINSEIAKTNGALAVLSSSECEDFSKVLNYFSNEQ